MSALPRLLRRAVLTAVSWGVGGYLLSRVVLAALALRGGAATGVPAHGAWFLIAATGGALFAPAAAALRAGGWRGSTSRRVLGVLGAVAMLLALLIADAWATGDPMGAVGGSLDRVWISLGVGAVLGWSTLAVGGARE